MVTIQNLTIKDLKQHILLENFSIVIDQKDKIGIIGEEGNGKSTLLKAIVDLSLVESYTETTGIIDKGQTKIGYFEQHLSNEWKDVYIYEYLLKEKPSDEIEVEQYNELEAYEKLCVNLHLPMDFIQRDQTIHTLSGGEKVKLQLLKLMHQPLELLLLDEPTNDLDIETFTWLETFMMELTIPVLFISHDEVLLSKTANKILHLEQLNKQTKCKHTLFTGGYKEYVEQRYHKREKEIQIANKEKKEYLKKKEKLNQIYNAVHDAQNDVVRNPFQAAALKRKMSGIKSMEKRFEKESYSHVDRIEEGIDVFFEPCNLPNNKCILEHHFDTITIDGKNLMNHVDLSIYGKDKIVITGANGSGKTIFMQELYELLKNRSDLKVGYMPQKYEIFFNEFDTPISFLLEDGNLNELSKVRSLLGSMKFTREEMEHCVFDLSEGQKAKLYLLNCIYRKCNVLLLDEPTRNLSPLSSPVIRQILKEYDGCMIAISHDRLFINEVAYKQYEIKEKELKIVNK